MVELPVVVTPTNNSENVILRSNIPDEDLSDLPTDLSKNQDMREVLVDEVSTRNRNQLVNIDSTPEKQDTSNYTREPKRDRETDLPINSDTRHGAVSRNKSTRLDGFHSVDTPAEKEERPNQDRLYGQVMHDEILEDTFRSHSIAEDHRTMQGDDMHEANLVDDLHRGDADCFTSTPPRDEEKRRKRKDLSGKRIRSKAVTEVADQPQSRPSSPPRTYDEMPEPSERHNIMDDQLDNRGGLQNSYEPFYRAEAPSSEENRSEHSTGSTKKRKKKSRKAADGSRREKRGKPSIKMADGSQSPPLSPPPSSVEPMDQALSENDLNEDEREEAEPRESGFAKGKSAKTRAWGSMKDRMKELKTHVAGKTKRKDGGEKESHMLSKDHDSDDSSTSSPTKGSKHAFSSKGKARDHSAEAEKPPPPPSIPRLEDESAPSRKGKTFQVGGLVVNPSMVIGLVLLGVAVFRGTSGLSASAFGLDTSGTSSGATTSSYIFGGMAVLIVVALLGTWYTGKPMKDIIYDKSVRLQSTETGDSADRGRAGRSADQARKQSTEDIDQEDMLLRDAQEQVKELFPHQKMQSAALTVFYDLMHAPWQDPDPESLQLLRELGRKVWEKPHRPKYKAALEDLREVAVQLFADYLRVPDRGAYLSGELLRIEVMSDHSAIRISAFPGENLDVNADMPREKANWKRGLQTIRQLSDEWSQLFPNQKMPPIEIVACRPPADFGVRQFQFLRECAKAPRQVDTVARKQYQGVKKQWSSCNSRGLPLSGIGRLADGTRDDTRAYMIHDLFELTQPTRIVIDYLPHRHRQAEALGWADTLTNTRLLRASCFSDVAKACAGYTQNNRLDILDLGPCLPMEQDDSDASHAGDIYFAFTKIQVGILRVALNESRDFRQDDGLTEIECFAATLCDRAKGMLPMFTGDTPAWLVLHVGSNKQKTDFKDTVEGLLFGRSIKSFRAKQLLALMSRACSTTEASASSSRLWSDAEIRELENLLGATG